MSFRGGYNICFDGVFILCWEGGGMELERIISALTLWFIGLREMRSGSIVVRTLIPWLVVVLNWGWWLVWQPSVFCGGWES